MADDDVTSTGIPYLDPVVHFRRLFSSKLLWVADGRYPASVTDVGTLDVASGRIGVCDPGLGWVGPLEPLVLEVPEGRYAVRAVEASGRVAALQVVVSKHEPVRYVAVGTVGVDAGTIAVFDLAPIAALEEPARQKLGDELLEQPVPFRAHTFYGKYPSVIASSSGWGDGRYPVVVGLDEHGGPAVIVIDFLVAGRAQRHRGRVELPKHLPSQRLFTIALEHLETTLRFARYGDALRCMSEGRFEIELELRDVIDERVPYTLRCPPEQDGKHLLEFVDAFTAGAPRWLRVDVAGVYGLTVPADTQLGDLVAVASPPRLMVGTLGELANTIAKRAPPELAEIPFYVCTSAHEAGLRPIQDVPERALPDELVKSGFEILNAGMRGLLSALYPLSEHGIPKDMVKYGFHPDLTLAQVIEAGNRSGFEPCRVP